MIIFNRSDFVLVRCFFFLTPYILILKNTNNLRPILTEAQLHRPPKVVAVSRFKNMILTKSTMIIFLFTTIDKYHESTGFLYTKLNLF